MARKPAILNPRSRLVLLWCCVLLTAALIFFFSAQNGEQSSQTSDGFVRVVVRLFCPGYDAMSPAAQKVLWNNVTFYIRKSAHFLEYAALGFFLRLLTRSLGLRWGGLWSWLSGTLYAGTDELHQMLSGGRSGMWQDVALDSAGVLFGMLAALALIAARTWRRGKKTSPP